MSKRGGAWVLVYVKSVYAVRDPGSGAPRSVLECLSDLIFTSFFVLTNPFENPTIIGWNDDRSAHHDSEGHHSPPWQLAQCFQKHATHLPSYPVSRFCTSCPDPKLDDTPLLFVEASLDANNNTVTSSAFQATPFAVLVSYLSQISTNSLASAKRLSSLARSGLVSLPRKYGPLMAHPPTYNASKPPSTDSRRT